MTPWEISEAINNSVGYYLWTQFYIGFLRVLFSAAITLGLIGTVWLLFYLWFKRVDHS